MILQPKLPQHKIEIEEPLLLDDTLIDKVSSFNYLGSTISEN